MSTITKATDLVGAATSRVENLAPSDVARELEQGAEVLLVDLREPSERAQAGAIPDGVNVPRGLLEFCADPSFPKYRPEFRPERRIIVYCASGGRSALAADTLAGMGYRDVAHLDGGFAAWADEGRPVETSA